MAAAHEAGHDDQDYAALLIQQLTEQLNAAVSVQKAASLTQLDVHRVRVASYSSLGSDMLTLNPRLAVELHAQPGCILCCKGDAIRFQVRLPGAAAPLLEHDMCSKQLRRKADEMMAADGTRLLMRSFGTQRELMYTFAVLGDGAAEERDWELRAVRFHMPLSDLL
eukprot:PLAT7045.15.p1 GENE.PLAT7045.15~~PLAT7045.15.p1  ORF type:complete len:166 (+),score=45.38 PLAT7045.15:42-539(+)